MTEEPFYGIERLASATLRGKKALEDPDSQFWKDGNPWKEAREMLDHEWRGRSLLERIEEEYGSVVASEMESIYDCMERVSETVEPLDQSYEGSPVMADAEFLLGVTSQLEQNYGVFSQGKYARAD